MTIVSAMPYAIANGQAEDAVPVMANFNWLMNQVNTNAAPLNGASGTPFNASTLTLAGILSSNVATGSPPFIVASTTLVANLYAATAANLPAAGATGPLLSKGATSGIGYATGAGGTVTLTVGGAPAACNTMSGRITTSSFTWVSGNIYRVVMLNSNIAAGDVVAVSLGDSGDYGGFSVSSVVIAGQCAVNIISYSAGTFAININFAIIKAVSA
jgi:hypothetical protein